MVLPATPLVSIIRRIVKSSKQMGKRSREKIEKEKKTENAAYEGCQQAEKEEIQGGNNIRDEPALRFALCRLNTQGFPLPLGHYVGKGLGRGGQFRHRRVAADALFTLDAGPGGSIAASDDELLETPSTSNKLKKSPKTSEFAVVEEEMIDYSDEGRGNLFLDIEAGLSDDSDEDVGFGLFDGSPPGTPGLKAFSAASIRYSPVSSESHEPGSLKDTESFEGAWSNNTLPCNAMGIERHAASVRIERLFAAHSDPEREPVGSKLYQDSRLTIPSSRLCMTFTDGLCGKLAGPWPPAIAIVMTGEEEMWKLVVEKARNWLDETMDANVLEEDWKEAESIILMEGG
ncbi:hypothetical protein DM02DRAFT_662068 [Periconia macrospinosa]|uniref:Uncharacterized protein n=1 Tax=Periconia macrospinosa TaxID=97972 RepID=A0A2V1D5J4_9PLEO|nr:hypothetical protein DM02DRAFT_662068 [Periconia macrospinosa]